MSRRGLRLKTSTKDDKGVALLKATTCLQAAFWDALLDLEQHLGLLIDETRDLSDWSLRQIRSCSADDVSRISWRDEMIGPRTSSAARSRS